MDSEDAEQPVMAVAPLAPTSRPHAQAIRDWLQGRGAAAAHTSMYVGPPGYSQDGQGTAYMSLPCPVCGTTGTIPSGPRYGELAGMPCQACFATGRIPTRQQLQQWLQLAQRYHIDIMLALRGWRHYLARLAAGADPEEFSTVITVKDDGRGRGRRTVGQRTEPPPSAAHAATLVQALEEELAALDDYMGELRSHLRAMNTMRHAVRQALREYEQARRQAAAAPAPAAKPARCRTPRCRKEPRVWDAQGRGWCREHAHRRGLLQREQVPGDE